MHNFFSNTDEDIFEMFFFNLEIDDSSVSLDSQSEDESPISWPDQCELCNAEKKH